MYFKLQATILIVSAGGGLYIFCLRTFKKMESLQCNSVFQTFMQTKLSRISSEGEQVDIFRIVYSDPSQDGTINIFSCKSYKIAIDYAV